MASETVAAGLRSPDPAVQVIPRPSLFSQLVWGLGLTALGWAWCELCLRGLQWSLLRAGTRAQEGPLDSVLCVPVVLSGVLVVLGIWRTWARRSGQEVAILSSAAVVLVGSATGVLYGTHWGFDGLYSDAGFRTEMVTRFADSSKLADYTYRGLPSYYPPLLPWLQGRAAMVLGVPGWMVMKPFQLIVCALLPFGSWLLWRRVISDPNAAWVATVSVGTAMPMKPDEWLVLTLVVPWWLEAVRGVRSPGVRVPRVVNSGTVLGALLLCHTFFFAPLAVATAAGFLSDALTRRSRPLPLRRASGVLALGLLVSAVSWLPPIVRHLAGAPSDDLQMRWSRVGFDIPFYPLHATLCTFIWGIGLVWILIELRRSRLAQGLALTLAASVGYMLLGQVAQRWQVAVLPEKAEELSQEVLLVAGTMGLVAASARFRRWRTVPMSPLWTGLIVAMVLVTLAPALSQWISQHMAGPAKPAQHMRYPDGSWPSGGSPGPLSHWHPWGVAPTGQGASVAQVDRAWRTMSGRPLGADTVLISSRSDILALTPAHAFLPWKSIYSNPLGQFRARLKVLRRLASCRAPACAISLLRRNEFDRVDGVVLNRDEIGYYLTVTTDTFPDAWVVYDLHFPPSIFTGAHFLRRVVAGTVIIRVR